jgi:dienelactone hydrolase family protein
MAMVMTDGSAMHSHAISNFTQTNVTSEGSTTHILKGRVTITMRDGPISGVPLTIKMFNNALIAMWIGPDRIDSHFGTDPVYGTLAVSSTAVLADMYDGMVMNDRPANTTSTMVQSSSVSYYGNASGYLVHPEDRANLPAVIMIHEWWGLNQQIRDAADRLANDGYAVLAVDLHDGEVATESSRAGQLAGFVRYNPD